MFKNKQRSLKKCSACHFDQFTRSCAPGYKWKKLNYPGTVFSLEQSC